jgi:hypothetical protein
MYQRFDQGFVGLIFSVFNTTPATQEQTVQLTAFQAVQGAAAAGGQQQQLEGCCSSDLDGIDEQMRAALAASAAGESHGSHAFQGYQNAGCGVMVAPLTASY